MRRIWLTWFLVCTLIVGCSGAGDAQQVVQEVGQRGAQDTVQQDDLTRTEDGLELADQVTEEALVRQEDGHQPDDLTAMADPVTDVCHPNCDGKECGLDGCGGSCGECAVDCTCGTDGQCLGCGTQLVQMVPACVHVPPMVAAGADFPVVVFAPDAPCGDFSHHEISIGGNSIHIELWAESMGAPCPPCVFDYLGVVWLKGVDPGGYTVTVGGTGTSHAMAASGGLISDPQCMGGCFPDMSGDWELVHLSTDAPLEVSCGSYQNLQAPAVLAGSCAAYDIDCAQWPGPSGVSACTGTQMLFGINDPMLPVTATLCQGDLLPHVDAMLGVMLGSGPEDTQAFLFAR